MAKETISYDELANRLDNVFMFNNAPVVDPEIYEGLENGTIEYCAVHDPCNEEVRNASEDDCEFETVEIYQWYLIGMSDAEYLKRISNELIFYSEVLDSHVWGVTHFGTPWSAVYLEVGEDEE